MIHYFQTLIHFIHSEKETLKLSAGQRLYTKGDCGLCMYLIKKGYVRISIDGAILELGREGSVLGEESLLERLPRLANVTAVTDCVIIPIDHGRMNILTKIWPDLIRKLEESMINRRNVLEIRLGRQADMPHSRGHC